jgi:hypothetical protein
MCGTVLVKQGRISFKRASAWTNLREEAIKEIFKGLEHLKEYCSLYVRKYT